VNRLANSENGASGTDEATGGPSPRRVAAVLLFFAAAREAVGHSRDDVEAATVAEALDIARARYGSPFGAVLERSRVWVNGEPATLDRHLCDGDEVAVLPPVSGGSGDRAGAGSW
jgi:molybdopterin converting factor small subunit